jgi:hypothetical protein
MTIRKLLGLGAIGISAAAAPVTFDADDGVFRLQAACGQATECAFATGYICSTTHNDYREYRCSKGCQPPQQT